MNSCRMSTLNGSNVKSVLLNWVYLYVVVIAIVAIVELV